MLTGSRGDHHDHLVPWSRPGHGGETAALVFSLAGGWRDGRLPVLSTGSAEATFTHVAILYVQRGLSPDFLTGPIWP
jgi:hypothetical protein